MAFHDEEWGVPVHDDRKLFELVVLSGAVAELTWPVILSRRHLFRKIFMDFDPIMVSKINDKKLIALGSTAYSLLLEPKLQGVIEKARLILKVPVKIPKANLISKDLVRRGFRGVGLTVIYSFMQIEGMTNDRLIRCHWFEECCVASNHIAQVGGSCINGEMTEVTKIGDDIGEKRIDDDLDMIDVDLELVRLVGRWVCVA